MPCRKNLTGVTFFVLTVWVYQSHMCWSHHVAWEKKLDNKLSRVSKFDQIARKAGVHRPWTAGFSSRPMFGSAWKGRQGSPRFRQHLRNTCFHCPQRHKKSSVNSKRQSSPVHVPHVHERVRPLGGRDDITKVRGDVTRHDRIPERVQVEPVLDVVVHATREAFARDRLDPPPVVESSRVNRAVLRLHMLQEHEPRLQNHLPIKGTNTYASDISGGWVFALQGFTSEGSLHELA